MVLALYCHQYCIHMLFPNRRVKDYARDYARDLTAVGKDCFKVLSFLSKENLSKGGAPIGTCFKTAFCCTYCVFKLGMDGVRKECDELWSNIYPWVWKTQIEISSQKKRTVVHSCSPNLIIVSGHVLGFSKHGENAFVEIFSNSVEQIYFFYGHDGRSGLPGSFRH
jgi:hypothetical protein